MNNTTPRRSGRPRKFDELTVVHNATLAFWRRGYDHTSADVLAEATGLGPSSLYNTFGSKRGLFLAALDHYNDMLADRLAPLTRGREGIADIDKFLRQLWQSRLNASAVPGCLMANTIGEGVDRDARITERTSGYEARIYSAFRSALSRAVSLGELPSSAPEPLAMVFTSSLVGALVVSRNRADVINEEYTEALMVTLRQWAGPDVA